MFEIGWFSTGRDEAARDLLRVVQREIEKGTIEGRIGFVLSNRERGEAKESDKFFDLVEEFGIELITFSSKRFKPEMRRRGRKDPRVMREWRIEYDRHLMERLKDRRMDLGVLAGYMLIVGPEMCERYKMINLHPAAPNGPTGTWQEVIWKLIEEGAEETGVMIHLVTEILDRGPVITYCKFPIRGPLFDPLWKEMEKKLESKSVEEIAREEGETNPLFMEIRRQGVIREIPLLVHTIREFASGNLRIEDGTVFAKGEPMPGGYDMSFQIDRMIESST